MKWIAFVLTLTTFSSFAQSNPQDCLKIKNALDRKYCMDKYIEGIKDKNEAEKKTWSAGLSQQAKDEKSAALESDIKSKKDWIKLLESEISLSETQLSDLKAAPVVAGKAPKKKKEKKKGGFKIKL